MTTYVVREHVMGGEYLGADGQRTPASDEAAEFETYDAAAAACDRGVDAVYVRTATRARSSRRKGRSIRPTTRTSGALA